MKWSVLDLGPAPAGGTERWNGDDRVEHVFRVEDAAPSGRRAGSRLLGLGLDAIRVALRARVHGAHGPLIAMNPWTTVAARLLGYNQVSTVGLYAVEGSRSWRLLRAAIGVRPVITLSQHEAERWQLAGGRSGAIRYGATFPPLEIPQSDVAGTRRNGLRIFVGGSSDRDKAAINDLVRRVRRRNDIHLVIAVGDRDDEDDEAVQHFGPIAPDQFSRLIVESDIVYLPLSDNGRAAGHMVLVEALQRGKPVVANWVAGMDEYFDDRHVIRARGDLVDQLAEVAASFRGKPEVLQDYWRRTHSSEAFGQRILDTLDALNQGTGR
jgi:glycosyltransferase involved in cell wall biosynthesis